MLYLSFLYCVRKTATLDARRLETVSDDPKESSMVYAE